MCAGKCVFFIIIMSVRGAGIIAFSLLLSLHLSLADMLCTKIL